MKTCDVARTRFPSGRGETGDGRCGNALRCSEIPFSVAVLWLELSEKFREFVATTFDDAHGFEVDHSSDFNIALPRKLTWNPHCQIASAFLYFDERRHSSSEDV